MSLRRGLSDKRCVESDRFSFLSGCNWRRSRIRHEAPPLQHQVLWHRAGEGSPRNNRSTMESLAGVVLGLLGIAVVLTNY